MSADWKVRRFVPDSDDDSDAESLNGFQDAETDTGAASKDALDIDAAFQAQADDQNPDKQQSDEVKESNISHESSPGSTAIDCEEEETPSILSSALSSLSSTPSSTFARSPKGQSPKVVDEPLLSYAPRNMQDTRPSKLHRSPGRFRQRKAIQLNPYAIESQLYKQSWKARGLIPLLIDNPSQLPAENDPGLSSSDLEEESQSVSGESQGESQTILPDSAFELGTISPIDLEEEEFPDLQPVLRRSPSDALLQGSKRRKIAHTYSKKVTDQSESKSPSNVFHVRRDGWVEVPFAANEGQSWKSDMPKHADDSNARSFRGRVSKVRDPAYPPSPIDTSPALPQCSPEPRSSSVRSSTGRNDVTPRQLQTPKPSSEARSHGSKPSGPADARTLSLRQPSTSHAEWSSDSEDQFDEEHSEAAALAELLKAQRRTRGVLPASWHRLEYQKLISKLQQPAPRSVEAGKVRRVERPSPSKETRKGVAKRIMKVPSEAFSGTDHTNSVPIDLESDSDESQSNLPARVQPNIDDYLMIDDSDDDMVMEDNSIDITAGGRRNSHSRRPRTAGKKIQTKIGKPFEARSQRIENAEPSTRPNHSSPGKGNPLTRTAMKSKPARRKISILDATQNPGHANAPNFIGYARRTARKRKDKTTYPPGWKAIHLHDAKEGIGTRESPRGQRDIRATNTRHNSPPVLRQPLHERSTNNAHGRVIFSDAEGDLQENATCPRSTSMHAFMTKQTERLPVAQTSNATSKKSIFRTAYPITSAIRSDYSSKPAQLEAERLAKKHGVAPLSETTLQLARYLRDEPTSEQRSELPRANPLKAPSRRRVGKRAPTQLTPTPWKHADDESGVTGSTLLSSEESLHHNTDLEAEALPGLLPYGLEYPTNFDIERLPDGQHFDADTLLGSGLFAESIHPMQCTDQNRPMLVTVNCSIKTWDKWNESVAEQVFDICQRALNLANPVPFKSSDLSSLAESLSGLRLVIKYLSKHLRFVDPDDRVNFARQWIPKLHKFTEQLNTSLEHYDTALSIESYIIQLAGSLAIIANQVSELVDGYALNTNVRGSLSEASYLLVDKAVQSIFQSGFESFRLFSQRIAQPAAQANRNTTECRVEILVVVSQLLTSGKWNRGSIWDILSRQNVLRVPDKINLPALELVWKNLFSMLPAMEIDSEGKVPKCIERPATYQNWKLIKQLIEPVFKAYSHARVHSTINQYCRKLYVRCFLLIDYWGWENCESILVLLFDFFAQNGLLDLQHETSQRSPTFLSNLTSNTTLTVRPSDRCFHILLKAVGRGLKAMRTTSTARKIGNCVWRLTPNHDRHLPKDEALRRHDLDAVRNHLDLLAVLYWATPPDQRIRVELIRRVIDIENSHKEVCRLVIRTWTNLARFQLSTQESATKIEPFMEWFDEIINKALKLRRLARTEVEADARLARISYGHHFSEDQQERTIFQSQRHAESILFGILLSLEELLNEDIAFVYLENMLPHSLKNVFELFDTSQPRASPVLTQLLSTVKAWCMALSKLNNIKMDQSAEDSQDFGDWRDIQRLELNALGAGSSTLPHNLDQVLQQSMSNLFGADTPVDDDLLFTTLDCWLQIKKLEVQAGRLAWIDLIDPYGQNSWAALRDTPQSRAYGPLFYAQVLKHDQANAANAVDCTAYKTYKQELLQYWFQCLVERESLIKYQPNFTATLLNHRLSRNDPLFQNLPFREEGGSFVISTPEFLDKRSSLISCLLSNMREDLSFTNYHQLEDGQEKRKNYSNLLRTLMNTMKSNYQSLDHGAESRGKYVNFVQKAVQSLQEYTYDICKVDEFFLDAVNIPLPIDDPEYLVGKLRHLALQLHEPGGPQKLAAFIQSLCERSVIEGQPHKYASLLAEAMQEAIEDGENSRVTLRCFICCHILPVYIESVASTDCGSIIVQTVLLSLPRTLETLLFQVDMCNNSGMLVVQTIGMNVIRSIGASLMSILKSTSIYEYRTQTTLTRYFEIISSMLIILDYICRTLLEVFPEMMDIMTFLKDSSLSLVDRLRHANISAEPPWLLSYPDRQNPLAPMEFEEAKAFISESLRTSLDPLSSRCKWRFDNDRLYVHRNGRWERLESDFTSTSAHQEELIATIKSFLVQLRTTPSFAWTLHESSIKDCGWRLHTELTEVEEAVNPSGHDLSRFF